VEAAPLTSTTADSCASALVNTWISQFGVPAQITSDRGPQFAGAAWAAFCKQVGVRHIMTTAYHPQSNGMVERVHRQLKAALSSRDCGANWAEHLPWVLMGIRAAPKDDTGISSAELVYGCSMVLPGELQVPSPPILDGLLAAPSQPPPHVTRLARWWRHHGGGKRLPQSLQQVEYVYIRRGYCGKPLAPVYSGPYKVLRRSLKYFILKSAVRTSHTVWTGSSLTWEHRRCRRRSPPGEVARRPRVLQPSSQTAEFWGGAPVAAAMRHSPPEKIRHLLLINAPVFYRLK
jgi:hypothetical protein